MQRSVECISHNRIGGGANRGARIVLAVFHTAQPRAREYLAEQLSRGQAAVEEVRSCAVCGYSKIMDAIAVWAGNAVVSVRCASAGKRCTVSVGQSILSCWWLAAFATEAV